MACRGAASSSANELRVFPPQAEGKKVLGRAHVDQTCENKTLNSTNQLPLVCEHARAEDAVEAAPLACGLGEP